MENLNTNFKTLTYFLISLFYKTDCKYSCSRTKIGKLLSILAFEYAIDGQKLFDEKIFKYDGCGTYVENIDWYVQRDVYMKYCYEDDKKYINDKLNNSFLLPAIIKQALYYPLPSDLLIATEAVFRRFGAYSQTDLGNLLNPIAEQATNESYGKIDLSKISSIIDKVDQNNEIVEYLKSRCLEKGKTKVKKYI